MSGVYAIVNVLTGERYVGSSSNIQRRWREHKRHLTSGTHHAPALQQAWNRQRSELFIFQMLEHVAPDDTLLIQREQVYLDATVACYNQQDKAAMPARRPEFKARMREVMNRPEVRANLRAAMKAYFEKPGSVARMRASLDNPATRAKKRASTLRAHARADVKERHRDGLLKSWDARRAAGWHPPPLTPEQRARFKAAALVREAKKREQRCSQ